MTKIIKCCPFCGSHEVQVCRTNDYACWIRCSGCGCDAESDPTRKGAIANWNRRHYDDATSVVVEDDEKASETGSILDHKILVRLT